MLGEFRPVLSEHNPYRLTNQTSSPLPPPSLTPLKGRQPLLGCMKRLLVVMFPAVPMHCHQQISMCVDHTPTPTPPPPSCFLSLSDPGLWNSGLNLAITSFFPLPTLHKDNGCHGVSLV